MKKVSVLILTLAMALALILGIPAISATGEPSAQIVAKQLRFGESVYITYIEKTKGYTVMNMLKQYGVTKEFKGVFMEVTMPIVFANLKVSGNQYDEIRTLLGDNK